ncbi:MAG: long-chain-acyl-CoA synthetase [Bradymonadales bacterium]|nr:long-chain-acyl-CoA synthetase [Bradymonadales bacterium]
MKSLTVNRIKPLRLAGSLVQRLAALHRYLHFDLDQETSMAGQLSDWASELGDAPFLLFGDRRWSFRQAENEVVRRAYLLSRLGIARGQVVALMMSNRPEFLFDALAINRLGAVSALVSTNLRGAVLAHALSLVDPVAVLVDRVQLATYTQATESDPGPGDGWDRASRSQGSSKQPDGSIGKRVYDSKVLSGPGSEGRLLLVDGEGSGQVTGLLGQVVDLHAELAALKMIPHVPGACGKGRDLALYIYTSGTTGHPKASRLTNARMLLAALAFGSGALGLGRSDTLYCCLPLFHASGFVIAFGSALFHGARFALAERFSARRFWPDIRQSGATVFIYIGEICRYLLDQPPQPSDRQHRLRAVIGNGLADDVWKAFVDRFRPGLVHEFYASTEGNVNIINFVGRACSVGHFLPFTGHDNALIVRYNKETRTPVRNRKGRCIPCRPGEVGELLGRIDATRVATRFEGYADPAQTATKILRDVLKPGDAYYRSGDLLQKDRLGFYYFVERIGDTFRWKGENVSTSQVAGILASHPDIAKASVYGVPIEGAEGKAGMAAIKVRSSASLDLEELYDYLTLAMPLYACPALIRLVAELKMTATYKVRVGEYAKEGFDPGRIEDPLFFRDDALQTYRRLDQVAYRRVLAGEIRF